MLLHHDSRTRATREEDVDLTLEEEAELERRLVDSLEAECKGELIPWEALFPRPRLTG